MCVMCVMLVVSLLVSVGWARIYVAGVAVRVGSEDGLAGWGMGGCG